jgi:LmbE family N-acetylglucosaminyl deacetylase
LSVPSLGAMLVVGAHPDDETFTAAGLMAAAVREGRRVVCVTATRGEGGSMDPEKWPPASMAEVRSREMRECMDVLGVEEHHFLGYVDGTCHEVDHEEGTERILAFMRRKEPGSSTRPRPPDGRSDSYRS